MDAMMHEDKLNSKASRQVLKTYHNFLTNRTDESTEEEEEVGFSEPSVSEMSRSGE